MPSSGPCYITAAINTDNGGGPAWTDLINVGSDDSSYTYIIPGGGAGPVTSDYLDAHTDGLLAIPGGATIDGIVVEIGRFQTDEGYGSTDVSDDTIQLLKAGAPVGDNKSTGANWPTSEATATYGGAADLWGTTWTAAEINDIDFGVRVAVLWNDYGNYALIDFIRITVYYTEDATVEGARRVVLFGVCRGICRGIGGS